MTQIHSRALLVWLTISTWTARKYDKKISAEVNAAHNASGDAGRFNKFLLPGDCASYKTLIAMAGAIRVSHYGETLAWSDEGWRLLPTANYMQYADNFRKRQGEYRNALDAFLADYPAMQAEAKIKLNGMYRAEDYPSVDAIRSRFALEIQYSPVPAVGDIRVDLGSDQIGAIEESITNRIETATKLAIGDAWARLHNVVKHISDRLSDPEAIFRDSLIGNAKDVCDALQRLNVTDDPNLEAMRVEVLSDLAMHDPDALRDDAVLRQRTAEKADQILATMQGLYGVQR